MPKPPRKRKKLTNADVRKLLRGEGRRVKRSIPKLSKADIEAIAKRIMQRALKGKKPRK